MHTEILNQLSTPVWILAAEHHDILFANPAARAMSDGRQLVELREGLYSAHAEQKLVSYLPSLYANEHVIEVWTVFAQGIETALSCQLSLVEHGSQGPAILVEGLIGAPVTPRIGSSPTEARLCSMPVCGDERSFYERLFRTNSAPMLLIDPDHDGRIIDVNHAATRFYGYPREVFCTKHTWEINALGRDVLPVMQEVAKLPGGHRPLHFIHHMADGTARHVQTYAGPLVIDGRRLMLCIIHDITEQKRLEEKLEKAALRDALTGAWNRRQFLHLLDYTHEQKLRYGHEYSVIFLDADHFKAINDQLGHDVGDATLKMLAHTLETRVRKADTVCRWGGEEFVILLPDTPLECAHHLAEALRETIEQTTHPMLPKLTVSIGVAQHEGDEETNALFRRADQALYRAKAAGRNRVVAATPAAEPRSDAA
ncbi:diguanylate cyclase [Nitrogeniibacter mangrovi]|uniref:diguanylate cyclase n=2 Tax=Nitrogeniibacter mangrovi TaxID=2016596 RepID=A0A6C1B8X4_9RHOO|nr:diguanylate cyclase [Nitrogeniibacter mangrovi]